MRSSTTGTPLAGRGGGGCGRAATGGHGQNEEAATREHVVCAALICSSDLRQGPASLFNRARPRPPTPHAPSLTRPRPVSLSLSLFRPPAESSAAAASTGAANGSKALIFSNIRITLADPASAKTPFIVLEKAGRKVQTRALRSSSGGGKDAAWVWSDAYSLECSPEGAGTTPAGAGGGLLAAVYNHGLLGLRDSLIGAGEVPASALPTSTSSHAASKPLTMALTEDDGTAVGSLTCQARLVNAADVQRYIIGGEEGGAGLAAGAGTGGAGLARPSPTRKADAKEEAGRSLPVGAGVGTGAGMGGMGMGGQATATTTRREGAMDRAKDEVERKREGATGGGGGGTGVGTGGAGTARTTRTLPTRSRDVDFEGAGAAGAFSSSAGQGGKAYGHNLPVGSVLEERETTAVEERVIERERVQPEREVRVFERVFKVTTTFMGERELTSRRRIETLPAVVHEMAVTAAAPIEAGAPKIEIERGAQHKYVAPGPAIATGGVVGIEEEGISGGGKGGRSIGEAIKDTFGIGRPSGGAQYAGEAETVGGGATKGRTSADERAALSRAEA